MFFCLCTILLGILILSIMAYFYFDFLTDKKTCSITKYKKTENNTFKEIKREPNFYEYFIFMINPKNKKVLLLFFAIVVLLFLFAVFCIVAGVMGLFI